MKKHIPARPGNHCDDCVTKRAARIFNHYTAIRKSGGVHWRDAFAAAIYADRVNHHGREGAAQWAAEQTARAFPVSRNVVKFGRKG